MSLLREEIFSQSWPTKPLGEVVEFLDNLRKPVKSSDRTEGDFNYYGANGLQGTIDDFLFDEPLVLLAEDGGHFGNPERNIAYIAEGKYWVNNHAHVLKPREGLDLRFLYRVLQKYDVSKYIKGATRAKLTKGDAAVMPIPLPH
ncbi:restriction endonuclease subunit S [Paraglaciecola sp. Hal342]